MYFIKLCDLFADRGINVSVSLYVNSLEVPLDSTTGVGKLLPCVIRLVCIIFNIVVFC